MHFAFIVAIRGLSMNNFIERVQGKGIPCLPPRNAKFIGRQVLVNGSHFIERIASAE
jgi:hypothetical protein